MRGQQPAISPSERGSKRTRGITQNEQSDISDDVREWKIIIKNGGSLVLKQRTISAQPECDTPY
jgi:hypothetical protein